MKEKATRGFVIILLMALCLPASALIQPATPDATSFVYYILSKTLFETCRKENMEMGYVAEVLTNKPENQFIAIAFYETPSKKLLPVNFGFDYTGLNDKKIEAVASRIVKAAVDIQKELNGASSR